MQNVNAVNDNTKSLLNDPIAIVAMSCRLPGADNPQAFWQILTEGNSPICEVPETWMNREIYFDPQLGKTGKSYTKIGAIFDTKDIEKEIRNYHFNEQFRNCDPFLKLACIVADEVLSQAKIPANNTNFGIYFGGLWASDLSLNYLLSIVSDITFKTLYNLPEFSSLPLQVQIEIVERCIDIVRQNYRNENYWNCQSPEIRLGDFVTNLRNIYGWTGTAYSLDAACSSSIIAIDCAVTDILAGKIQGALVGGISSMTILTPLLFSKNYAAATTLSCPFDANADGIVGSMGIIFTFLKTLKSAENNGDNILGLIRSIGFSSDGRGKSLWAPRPEGELLAMKRAYQKTNITPQQLTYLEAHATSTSVGDSTELKTIQNLLNYSQEELQNDYSQLNNTNDNHKTSDFSYKNSLSISDQIENNVTNNQHKRKLAIGSVKANFGHLFEAAGLLGLMKITQICKNKIIPAQINISQLHPDIFNKPLPFFIPLEPVPLNNSNNSSYNVNSGDNSGDNFGDKSNSKSDQYSDETLFFGLNSFGIGGLNSHLIFEEYKKDKTQSTDNQQKTTAVPAASVSPVDLVSPVVRKAVAVLGIGCVFPRAFSVEQFREILKQKIDPKQTLSPIEFNRRYFSEQKIAESTEIHGGFIENYLYNWELHKIPPLQIQRCDPLQTYVMGAVDEAISQAVTGRELSNEERDKTFVVAGAEHLSNFFYEYQLAIRAYELGQVVRNSATIILSKYENDENYKNLKNQFAEQFADQIADQFDSSNSDVALKSYARLVSDKISKSFVKKIFRDNPCVSDVTGGFTSSSLTSRITKLYDVHGGAFTIDGGLVSSLIAIDYSLQKLRSGESLIGICIGAYRWTNSHAFEFYKSKYGETFFPLAEGAGAVVLKSIDQVDHSKEKPLGLIYEIINITQCKIDKSVWESLDLSVEDIQFISIASPKPSTHLALFENFFRSEKRIHPIPVTTCFNQFGNLCTASGMAELIKSFLILQDKIIPPQFDWKDKLNETSIFFVTKIPVELKLNERSFAILFDLDNDGNGYAAILLPNISQNNETTELQSLKPRPIERQNLQNIQKLLNTDLITNKELTNKEITKNVYIYRQLGASYEMGFGLGAADSAKIEDLIHKYDEIQLQDTLTNNGELNMNSILSNDRKLERELLGENGVDELRGLADGSGVPFEKLFLHNIRFYSALTGIHFMLRDAGIFKHVIIVENSLCEIINGNFDVHLSEREPADSEPYVCISATGCVGGFVSCRAEISVSILPRIQNTLAKNQFNTNSNSNLSTFVNIGLLLKKFSTIANNQNDPPPQKINSSPDILIVDTLRGNFINDAKNFEHDLATTQNIIQKFSSSRRYFCTIMLNNNSIEIL